MITVLYKRYFSVRPVTWWLVKTSLESISFPYNLSNFCLLWTFNLMSVLCFFDYRQIPKISSRAYIFQRPFLRGLFLEGLMYGGGSLYWEGNLQFLLCFTLYSRANSKYKPTGGLYSEGRFNRGFFVSRFSVAYVWRSLFSEFYG